MSDEQPTPQTIQLDFISADERHPDPATVGEFGHAVVKQLQSDGYDMQPLYTGEKGGEHFILTIVQAVWDHKEIIASTVGSAIEGSATLIGNIIIIVEAVEKVRKKSKHEQQDSDNITVTIDGKEVISGPPKAVSQYMEQLKSKDTQDKRVGISVKVPAKPKKRRK